MKRRFLILPLLAFATFDCSCVAPPPPDEVRPKPSGDVRAVDLADGVRLQMLPVPGGTFRMGSPRSENGRTPTQEDPVSVTLSRDFWLAETEVSQAAWAAVMDGETVVDLARKCLADDVRIGGRTVREALGLPRDADPVSFAGPREPDFPVVWVSWTEAAEFCRRIDERERAAGRVPDGYEYRLPTEAEWERACRAGETAALPNGRSLRYVVQFVQPELDDIAWYCGNCSTNPVPANADPLRRGWGLAVNTRPVGTKAPNAWGFHDMIGNVFEWCADVLPPGDFRLPGGTDPVRLSPAGIRANRGGSWAVVPQAFLRSAARSFCPEGIRCNDLGFRPALAPIFFREAHPATPSPAAEETHAESAETAESGSPAGGAGERSETEGVSHAETAETAEP